MVVAEALLVAVDSAVDAGAAAAVVAAEALHVEDLAVVPVAVVAESAAKRARAEPPLGLPQPDSKHAAFDK